MSRIKIKKKKVLVDCSHICYTVYYGCKDQESPICVIQGFINRVLQLMEEFHTSDLIFFWDSPVSIRQKKHTFYKQTRAKKKKEDPNLPNMFEQRKLLKEVVLPGLGFLNHIEIEGYEADDTMAQIVENYPNKRFVIVANDNDLFQILKNKNLIGIFSCRSNELFDKTNFIHKYDIEPTEWNLVKALGGCGSDEVPGIPGVGEKTAIKYLNEKLSTSCQAYKTIQTHLTTTFIRNHWLVTLPLSGIPKNYKFLRNRLTKENQTVIEDCYDINFEKEWRRYYARRR